MKRNKPVYNGDNWQDLSVSKVFDLNGITSNYIDDRFSSTRSRIVVLNICVVLDVVLGVVYGLVYCLVLSK